jgi:hypothetical protein
VISAGSNEVGERLITEVGATEDRTPAVRKISLRVAVAKLKNRNRIVRGQEVGSQRIEKTLLDRINKIYMIKIRYTVKGIRFKVATS